VKSAVIGGLPQYELGYEETECGRLTVYMNFLKAKYA